MNDHEIIQQLRRFQRDVNRAARRLGIEVRAVGPRGALRLFRDLISEGLKRSGETFACGAGCSYCCTQQVAVTAPEVFDIADHLRSLPELERQAIVEKLRKGAEAYARATYAIDVSLIACGLLGPGGVCTVYPVRPLRCVGFVSSTVEPCIEALADKLTLTQHTPASHNAALLADATVKAITDDNSKRVNTEYELNSAVLRALPDPTAEARWMAGEDVLRGATPALPLASEDQAVVATLGQQRIELKVKQR